MLGVCTTTFLALCCLRSAFAHQATFSTSPAGHLQDLGESYEFSHPIRRVAVIGAGANGLLHAAALLEAGLEVRMFERAPRPGGTWNYNEKKPVPASFPNRPLKISAYIPDIPKRLPLTHVYTDGDEGLSNDLRLREHSVPSPIWANMNTVSPAFRMYLPNTEMPPDTLWTPPNSQVRRLIRQYASSVGLNANDEDHANATSYSTRVEHIHKPYGSKKWTLALRKMVEIPHSNGKLRVDWWTEEFDAVVVGTNSECDAPWVPSIPGLSEWAHAFPDRIHHSRDYRRPDGFRGKKVLLVGGSLSAAGIALNIAKYASSISVSVKIQPEDMDPVRKSFVTHRFPRNVTYVREIKSFPKYSEGQGIRDAAILLGNGTTISGFDYIIFATGYRKSFPFLADFHNSTIVGLDEPQTEAAPILTDGTHLRSLHWTGHYIPDPTLAIATTYPWGVGPYQALGFAKVWSGKARIPSISSMWHAYPGAGHELSAVPATGEVINRLFITWLNEANLEFGGRLVEPISRKHDNHQAMAYFAARYGLDFIDATHFDNLENMPRSEWPSRNGELGDKARGLTKPTLIDEWMDFSENW